MNYKDQYKHPKWQKRRLEILERDSFKCQKCGDDETTLNVHHKIYYDGRNVWDYDESELITLCEHCHGEISQYKNMTVDDFDNVKIYKSKTEEGYNMILSIMGNFLISDSGSGLVLNTHKIKLKAREFINHAIKFSKNG